MVRRLLMALVLLSLAAVPLRADPTVSTYSFTPDLAVYGPQVPVEVRMEIAGGQSSGYTLVLQSELVFRKWYVVVDQAETNGSMGDPSSPMEVSVPALASTIKVSLSGSTPNLNPQVPKVLFRADWKDGAGALHLLKSERRQVGPESVAATPTPTPSPSPTPTPTSTPTPTPMPVARPGTLKVVVEPPGLAASIYVDGKFGGNASYEATLASGQYLVTFGEVPGYEKPASQTVTLSERGLLVAGQYRAIAAPSPTPTPTPAPATPSPTPPTPGPSIPIAAVGGVAAVVVAAGVIALVLKKRKAGPPPPAPEAPPPEAPPPEPPSAPPETESMPEEVSLGVLQEKKQKIESKKARLEEQKEKGEVTPEEYEEKRKRYEREIEELAKEIAKKGGS